MLVPPPVIALAAALVQRRLGSPRPPGGPRSVPAAGLVGASLALALGADAAFKRAGTTIMPMDPTLTTALVTTGVNARTRNPMYLGLTGLLTAHALWRGSWPAMLPVAGFVAVIDRVQIAAEEKALSDRFGAEYDAYRAAVPRWAGRRTVTG